MSEVIESEEIRMNWIQGICVPV